MLSRIFLNASPIRASTIPQQSILVSALQADYYCTCTALQRNLIFQCLRLNKKSRQLSTFPLKSSIIDVRELDFRVRNGNGYCLSTMATGIYKQFNQKESGKSFLQEHRDGKNVSHSKENFNGKNGKDNMVKPHDLLVMLG